MGRRWVLASLVAPGVLVPCRCSRQCGGIWTRDLSQADAGLPNTSTHDKLMASIIAHRCPFGVKLLGDVTWPDPPEELRDRVNPLGWLQIVAVVWSYIPYGVAIRAAGMFFWVRGTRQLFVLAWLALFVFFNEGVVKKLPWMQEPRPGNELQVRTYNGMLAGSCLDSCGMPSSHSGLASGLMVLMFFDASARVRIVNNKRTEASPDHTTDDLKGLLASTKDVLANETETWRSIIKHLPWKRRDTYTLTQFVLLISLWVTILIPVISSRIILYDHTVWQTLAGSLWGVVGALLWVRIGRNLQRAYRAHEGRKVFYGLLCHNFPEQDKIRRAPTSSDSDSSGTESSSS